MIVSDFLNSAKRSGLVDTLVSVRVETEQTDLLGRASYEQDLNKLLDEIATLTSSRIPLYKRWSDEIDGKDRNIGVPKQALSRLLKGYVLPLVNSRKPHGACHGGEKGWSPRSSLETHLPCSRALSFDLKSAFELFSPEEVYGFFKDFFEDSAYEEETARFLTLISTVSYEHGRGLPVGSPLAMALFNRALFSLDETLSVG